MYHAKRLKKTEAGIYVCCISLVWKLSHLYWHFSRVHLNTFFVHVEGTLKANTKPR